MPAKPPPLFAGSQRNVGRTGHRRLRAGDGVHPLRAAAQTPVEFEGHLIGIEVHVHGRLLRDAGALHNQVLGSIQEGDVANLADGVGLLQRHHITAQQLAALVAVSAGRQPQGGPPKATSTAPS